MVGKLLFATMLLSLVTTNVAQGSAPNVLLIVADDMGYSDIGPFGGEIATPTLDILAQEGLRLANFHVLASCSPSRSVLLSGMDNHRAGLGTMNERMSDDIRGKPGYEGHLNHRVAALPEVLKANGYRTYMVGKWHLGEDESTVPHARGFDETFVLVDGGGSHWADSKWITPTIPMTYSRNGKEVDSLPEDLYSSKDYTDALVEWIKRDQGNDQPFFAYLAYTAPHDPLHAPKEYIDKYKGVYDGGWDNLRGKRLQRLKELGIIDQNAKPFPRLPAVEAWEELSEEERALAARDMEVYAAMVDYMDGQIKRVIDQLKASGDYENTLIIFFSDNGANGASVMNYPGQTEEYVSSFDNRLDNRGLENSMIDQGPGVNEVGYELFGMKAFIAGHWKALWMPLPNGTGEWELFDLKLDPGELNDLAKKHPQQLEELVNRWEQYEEENGVLDLSSGGGQ